MKKEEVYLVNVTDSGYRHGTPARIVGVKMCTPEGLKKRLCYHLKWSDGVEDFKPVGEVDYELLTFSDIIKQAQTNPKFDIPEDNREFKLWQKVNGVTRKTDSCDYEWGGFTYRRAFLLRKFQEYKNRTAFK